MSDSKVSFRALEPEDITHLYEWENNIEVSEVSLSKIPYSKYILEQYINHSQMNIQQAGQVRFIIESSEVGVAGCIDLYEYDSIDRRAGVGILIDKKYRGRGIAQESIKQIKEYAFDVLGLHQLYCSISHNNDKSIKLFESSGFMKVGVRQQWRYRGGKFHDVIEYQLLSSNI